jgi:hypothetical protein
LFEIGQPRVRHTAARLGYFVSLALPAIACRHDEIPLEQDMNTLNARSINESLAAERG